MCVFNLDFPDSTTVNYINLLSLYISQSQAFRYSNRKKYKVFHGQERKMVWRRRGVEEGVWRKGCRGRDVEEGISGGEAHMLLSPHCSDQTISQGGGLAGKQTQVSMSKQSSHLKGNVRGFILEPNMRRAQSSEI